MLLLNMPSYSCIQYILHLWMQILRSKFIERMTIKTLKINSSKSPNLFPLFGLTREVPEPSIFWINICARVDSHMLMPKIIFIFVQSICKLSYRPTKTLKLWDWDEILTKMLYKVIDGAESEAEVRVKNFFI